MVKLTVFNNLVDQKSLLSGSLTTHLTYMEKNSLAFVYMLAMESTSNETKVLTKIHCKMLFTSIYQLV